MSWIYKFEDSAKRVFAKLDRPAQAKILRYLEERVICAEDPTEFGKPLRREKFGVWHYRVGAYRIVCSIDRGQLLILVVAVGHRSSIYD